MAAEKGVVKKLHEGWLSFTLKQKIGTFAAMVILIVALSIVFNIVILDFALNGFNQILEDNSKCHDYQTAMEEEARAFQNFIRDTGGDNRELYATACVKTERCIKSLPFDYDRIGGERYAITWSIRSGYENYRSWRDSVIQMNEDDGYAVQQYVNELYRVYRMQDYLSGYGKRLAESTLREGSDAYHAKVPVLSRFPYAIFVLAVLSIGVTFYLSRMMHRDMVIPVVRLAHMSRKIAKNDFTEEDITVENQDEMGELVRAFNKMKHATEQYITTLKEKNEMADLLHKEEIEKMEMEKRLDATKLELLKNQINPHFLFNTLNMIACMAKLEDAVTTERMIESLGNLFRYNLKTPESEVLLKKEIEVVSDYMYLQQMRFGSRLHYDIQCLVDGSRIMIPTFTLQPLVENAVIHGLSKKENGGSIRIRVWERNKKIVISVADTGVGMCEEDLHELRKALKLHSTAKVGIGVGNIYQRIQRMYEGGEFSIYSREGHGTAVQLAIPVQL
ncbi:sensor histidine kinase [Clostridium sp. Marseille-P2415]|uniref:sensor histidine kinase n=1 Tax=Clostridium sp. Marseille-P2415 TaxID=1805471 RepID=UPI001F231E5D|nr:histidine kinase [Clostridium sp. Marseille-P2415]